VGLNGARQVDLTTGTAGMQFSLGGGPGIYNPPYVAADLAVLPGQSNAVAVYSNAGVVTVYDTGVARPNKSSGLNIYFNSNYGSLSFGNDATTLYLNSQSIGTTLYALTVDSTGVTTVKNLGTGASGNTVQAIQYDNGRIYAANGAVLDATQAINSANFRWRLTVAAV
jgi:trimeric autotransporter adhesin